MAVSSLPVKFSKVKAEFSGSATNMGAYIKGGSFVGTGDYGVSSVSTTLNGLKLSQFASSAKMLSNDFYPSTNSIYIDSFGGITTPENGYALDSAFASIGLTRENIDVGLWSGDTGQIDYSTFRVGSSTTYLSDALTSTMVVSSVTASINMKKGAGIAAYGSASFFYNGNASQLNIVPSQSLSTTATTYSANSTSPTRAQLLNGALTGSVYQWCNGGTTSGGTTGNTDAMWMTIKYYNSAAI